MKIGGAFDRSRWNGFRDLHGSLGVPIRGDLKTWLLKVAQLYVDNSNLAIPRQGESHRNLQRLQQSTEKLQTSLSLLDELSIQRLALSNPYPTHIKRVYQLIDSLPKDLRKLKEAVDSVLLKPANSKDKGGPPPAYALNVLICQLAVIYKETAKRRATVTWNSYSSSYEGGFLTFVNAFLHAFGFGKDVHSETALAQAIKRAMKSKGTVPSPVPVSTLRASTDNDSGGINPDNWVATHRTTPLHRLKTPSKNRKS